MNKRYLKNLENLKIFKSCIHKEKSENKIEIM